MSRSVRDLRELICVSRLTFQESDKEEEIWNGEERMCQTFSSLDLSDGSSSTTSRSSLDGTNQQGHLGSPDSVVAVSGLHINRSRDSIRGGMPAAAEPSPVKAGSRCGSKSKSSRKNRRRYMQQSTKLQHDLPKPSPLPPVQGKCCLLAEESSQSEGNDEGVCAGNCSGDFQTKRSNFDDVLTYMDATIVAEWLTRASIALDNITNYCSKDDNFVQFAHFWLSEFPENQKHEIYDMEHEILVEEVGLAFAVGKESGKIVRRDVTDLISALFREYPTKLFSSKGTHLFLNYLDVLTSERDECYKKLLADVRCCTHNRQFAQWLLATRSFALVSMWSAIINFYRNLLGHQGLHVGQSVSSLGLSFKDSHHDRLLQAVRIGFPDVVHYLVSCGHVDVKQSDLHGRSLLFTAVMHNQPNVVRYLITRDGCSLDVNQACDTGNTPLHAAANSGNTETVKVLCRSPGINVNIPNLQCENATPLHLAVMHGHRKVVETLIAAGADPTLKMGDLTAADIARDFNHQDLLALLHS